MKKVELTQKENPNFLEMVNNFLVIGSGAREHAIIWRLSKDNNVDEIICLGENAGVSEIAKTIILFVGNAYKRNGSLRILSVFVRRGLQNQQ